MLYRAIPECMPILLLRFILNSQTSPYALHVNIQSFKDQFQGLCYPFTAFEHDITAQLLFARFTQVFYPDIPEK